MNEGDLLRYYLHNDDILTHGGHHGSICRFKDLELCGLRCAQFYEFVHKVSEFLQVET